MSLPWKLALIAVGTLSTALGIAGIFLPLLPTTPFLLLASACYVRSSDRLHQRLLNHKHLGPYIRNFQDKRGMPMRAKVYTLAILWVSLGVSFYAINRLPARIFLILCGTGTSTYILRMKTMRETDDALQESWASGE